MTFSTGGTLLPINELFDRLNGDKAWVILCATNRIARNLRLTFGQRQIKNGESNWPTPATCTVDDWLSDMGDQISLLGEIPAEIIPDRVLTPFQECMVWKQSIEAAGREDPALPLFDLHSLARTATEAHALINTWHLQITGEDGSEETRQFIGWRKRFNETCKKNKWVDVTEYQKRVLGWIERGGGTLPLHVVFAGFDTLSPHQNQLQKILEKRGVEIFNLEFLTHPADTIHTISCDDAEAECRAAAAWSSKVLENNPDARIGIVVADLETRRTMIIRALDEALDPAALASADDSSPRQYNVSLGLPLTRYGLVRSAMALLHLLGNPKGLPLTEFGDLLRMPYWSADQSEADIRALTDAKLRERPGQTLNINTVLRVVKTIDNKNESKLLDHLRWLEDERQKLQKPRKPGEWASAFRETLSKVNWPGERTLSSTEFQTQAAFFETLSLFAELDTFLGPIGITTAIGEFARLCREKIFQPKTAGQPAVQVLGLIEAKGAEFDALWVMGMNDQHWPSPARPNPLLSAELQRRYKTPGSCAEVQSRFALDIHQRLLHSAPDITFSHAKKEGERELQPSPLICDIPQTARPSRSEPERASTIFGHIGSENHDEASFEYLDDHFAPPLKDGEKVSGGSGLLKAQAICPAWAFYRYRLGAKQLEIPSEGLDASRRGTMVHSMLEAFWKTVCDSITLQEMPDKQRQATIADAAEIALKTFEDEIGEPLTPAFRRLEASRLQRLCTQWLSVEQGDTDTEKGRTNFKVITCEEKHTIDIGHLRINLVIDRIDELLDDGRRIVLDYKTGSAIDTKNWHRKRLTEPQLPLYASIVLAGQDQPQVAAVAFAKVRLGECEFKGVAADSHLLPGVSGLRPIPHDRDEPEGRASNGKGGPDSAHVPTAASEAEEFTRIDKWQELLGQWKERLEAIAEEIHCGEAAVRFDDLKDLRYCDALPLLRVAERKQQFERQVAKP